MTKIVEKTALKHQLALEDFLANHSGVEDLLTPEELNEYVTLPWPDNVPVLHDALKKRIEKDPEYELWVPSEYVTFSLYEQDVLSHFVTQYQFVSSKGRVVNLAKRKKEIHTGRDSSGYRYTSMRLEGFPKPYKSAGIHRIAATVFIPRPDHLKETPHYLLEVNHKDGIKDHNEFRNLEWCTTQENIKHAVSMNLKASGLHSPRTTPVVGTCVLETHHGKEIMLAGNRSIKEMGFIPTNLLRCAKSGKGVVYGCKWRYATNEDIINHNNLLHDSEFIKVLKRHASRLKANIEGTHTITGHKVLFINAKDMKEQGFHHSAVYNVVNGKQLTHKGYTFKRISLEDINSN